MPKIPPEDCIRLTRERVRDLFGANVRERMVRGHEHVKLFEVDSVSLRVAVALRGDSVSVARAIRQCKEAAGTQPNSIPTICVPYMGDAGMRLCKEANVCWMDLSGNARLVGGRGLRIEILGNPNQFKIRGRPRDLFAPKSSRITRCLLLEPRRAFMQRELAERSRLDEGFTSRIVRDLEERELVCRDATGRVRASDPGLLLSAWREAYNFDRHVIIPGHIAERSSERLLQTLSTNLKAAGIRHAFTGLAGAWLLRGFTGFRLITLFTAEASEEILRVSAGFAKGERGANVWLVRPADAFVFEGSRNEAGAFCAHPLQVYLDLKEQPERSAEAAEDLRGFLNKSFSDD